MAWGRTLRPRSEFIIAILMLLAALILAVLEVTHWF
jgi:hypothetical protein